MPQPKTKQWRRVRRRRGERSRGSGAATTRGHACASRSSPCELQPTDTFGATHAWTSIFHVGCASMKFQQCAGASKGIDAVPIDQRSTVLIGCNWRRPFTFPCLQRESQEVHENGPNMYSSRAVKTPQNTVAQTSTARFTSQQQSHALCTLAGCVCTGCIAIVGTTTLCYQQSVQA